MIQAQYDHTTVTYVNGMCKATYQQMPLHIQTKYTYDLLCDISGGLLSDLLARRSK